MLEVDFLYRLVFRRSSLSGFASISGFYVDYEYLSPNSYFVMDCGDDGIVRVPADNVAYIQAVNNASGDHASRKDLD